MGHCNIGTQPLTLVKWHRPFACPPQQVRIFTAGHSKHITGGGILSYAAKIIINKCQTVMLPLEQVIRLVSRYYYRNRAVYYFSILVMGQHSRILLQFLLKQPVGIVSSGLKIYHQYYRVLIAGIYITVILHYPVIE